MRLTPRRIVLMVVTALLSAELTGAWVLSREPTYEGSVTVFLSQLFPRGTAVIDIDPFAETFQLTMRAPERTAEIATAAGVAQSEVQAKLRTTRNGQSPIVRVVYGPGANDTVTTVAQQAAVVSLQELSQAELDRAEARLAQARTAADASRKALSDFEAETDLVDLDQAYEDLRIELVDQLSGDGAPATIAASQAELDRLAGLRLQRDELQARLNGAVASIASAEDERLGAEARLAAAGSSSLVLVNAPEPISRLPLLARGIIGAGLVTLAGWFAVFALIDRRNRRRGAGHRDGGGLTFEDERPPARRTDRDERGTDVGDRVGTGAGVRGFTASLLAARPRD